MYLWKSSNASLAIVMSNTNASGATYVNKNPIQVKLRIPTNSEDGDELAQSNDQEEQIEEKFELIDQH